MTDKILSRSICIININLNQIPIKEKFELAFIATSFSLAFP